MLFVLTTCPCNISVIHILPKNIIYHTGHISRQKMTSIQAITASGGLRERHKQKNKKEANAKKDVVKTGPTFGLPFDQLWPSMPRMHSDMVREEIKRTFNQTFTDQWLLQKKKKLEKNLNISTEQIPAILLQLMEKNERYVEMDRQQTLSTLGDNNRIQSFNEHLVLGINNVTRCLENNQKFSLVVVCRSAQPSLMTQQIMCQCLLSDVPACAVHQLSETVAPILNLKSVLAIAFKCVENSSLASLVEFIKDKIPEQTTDWARLWKVSAVPATCETESQLDIQARKATKRPAADNHFNDSVDFHELNIVWKSLNPKKTKQEGRKKKKKNANNVIPS